ESVNLAIVNQVAVRMCASPTRKSIRAEARMDHRDRRFDQGIGEIRIESLQLSRCKHAFVNKRPARQARNIKKVSARKSCISNGILCTPPNHVKFALEGQVICDGVAATDEYLADERFVCFRRIAQVHIVGRYLAPAQTLLSFLLDNLFNRLLELPALLAVIRQEDHSNAV